MEFSAKTYFVFLTGLSSAESFFFSFEVLDVTSSTLPPASLTAFNAPLVRLIPWIVSFLVTSPERNILALRDKFGIRFAAFKDNKSKFFIISFSSDWLYPTIENKEIVIALNACGANVRFVEINSDKGHDSFLLDVPEFLKTIAEFVSSTYNEIKK